MAQRVAMNEAVAVVEMTGSVGMGECRSWQEV